MVTLSGGLGVGKSVLARSMIRTLAQDPLFEVPSPTYTICNHYDTLPVPIAHCDLYRISDPRELDELGLPDALDLGCVIVEWPENGFDELPHNALQLKLKQTGDVTRTVHASGGADVMMRFARSLAIRKFLNSSGNEKASRGPLSADASDRRYELIKPAGAPPLLLMDAPEMPDGPPVRDGKPYSRIAHLAENVTAFVAIGKLLREAGYAAPEIPAYDLHDGLALIEHLGDGLIIDDARRPIEERYLVSMEFLADMHGKPVADHYCFPDGTRYSIPSYDRDAVLIEAELLLDWYVPFASGKPANKAETDEFRAIWNELFDQLDAHETTLVLRDFHSPNVIWRGDQSGIDRVGVIDFQDALIGPTAYDVASLAQDARVDVSAELETKLLHHYIELRHRTNPEFDREALQAGYAIMSAQRATKILGIFVRLKERDGKGQYLKHLPRIQDYLSRSLAHPAMQRYQEWCANVIEL